MQDKFLESVRLGFISQIEEIINEAKISSEEKELNAIDTLVLVNNNISSWISSINGMFHIDEELLTKVAELKRPFVSAAKKEVAAEVSKIIETESTDVTSKINNFMSELKKKGLDLDGDNEKESKKTTTTLESQTHSSPVDTSSRDLEPSFDFGRQRVLIGRQRVLKREIERPRRSTTDCPSETCGGGSSGCDGGDC